MFEPLYRYLIRHKQVGLSGIGTFLMETKPAKTEFVNRCFLPSTNSFVFEQGKEITSRKLFSWLATALGITEREAVIRLNDFVFDLRKELDSGKEIMWDGVGKLKKGLAGEIKFKPAAKELAFQQPVIAEKVIRENAGHTMRVGEQEITSIEMAEFLSGEMTVTEKRSFWWVGPLAILVVIFMFLGWYFSKHGMNPSSFGNTRAISPTESSRGN